MFTGIITEVGRVETRTASPGGVDLWVDAPASSPRLVLGASIALNGVCQTVVELDSPAGTARRFRVQAVGATLERTTLGVLAEGARLNLEPSLRVGDELGGHLVMGHVDGLGVVRAVEPKGDAVYLTITLPIDLLRFVAPRGSLAVDGTSLTVAAVTGDDVVISLIPHTWTETIAHAYEPGDRVNLEIDLVARYLDRLLDGRNR